VLQILDLSSNFLGLHPECRFWPVPTPKPAHSVAYPTSLSYLITVFNFLTAPLIISSYYYRLKWIWRLEVGNGEPDVSWSVLRDTRTRMNHSYLRFGFGQLVLAFSLMLRLTSPLSALCFTLFILRKCFPFLNVYTRNSFR